MNASNSRYAIAILVFFLTSIPGVKAEQHIEKVLHHADDAVHSPGDSHAIAEHAREALALIGEAESSNAGNQYVVKLIGQSEVALEAAVTNAARFHSISALENAVEAERLLEAADQTADSATSGPWPIEQGPEHK
jgi:hypothetical protein